MALVSLLPALPAKVRNLLFGANLPSLSFRNERKWARVECPGFLLARVWDE